ncbi:MAG: GrpB family protein [Clostridiales bacterium]|nr:GrpB family protein [Clostridiales bacterium]
MTHDTKIREIMPTEMTDKERSRLFPIILCEYNPAWPEWFQEEKTNLENLIGQGRIFRITHYGSTAVPGLLAKPTVDILLEINEDTDIEDLIAVLPYPEYMKMPEADKADVPPLHMMFVKGYAHDGFAEKVYHIHVRYPGDWDEVHFRDYLIAHPEAADAYAALKRTLKERFEHDRDGYTNAKGDFIEKCGYVRIATTS